MIEEGEEEEAESESESDGEDYGSDGEEEGEKGGLEQDGEEDDDVGSEEEDGDDTAAGAADGEEGEKEKRVRGKKSSSKKVRGVLTKEQLQMFKDKAEQTGVIYLSRIPPFMKPIKIRHYFSAYGTVGRIYLQAEGRCCCALPWRLCVRALLVFGPGVCC